MVSGRKIKQIKNIGSVGMAILLVALGVLMSVFWLNTPKDAQAAVEASSLKFKQVTQGDHHTCGLTTDGAVFCWGENAKGQLGIGSTVNMNKPTPIDTVAISGSKVFTSIDAGNYHTCGITADRVAYCWGDNDWGQLGYGIANGYELQPTAVLRSGSMMNTFFIAISAGAFHTCAVNSDFSVFCWGSGNNGRLGIGDYYPRSEPQQVYYGGRYFESVTAGDQHSCALATDGSVACWGGNSSGQLGNMGNSTALTPQQAYMPEPVKSISASKDHTCAVAYSGKGYCWGENGYGQLGIFSNANTSMPTQLYQTGGFSGKLVDTISAGLYHTCATSTDGKAYCWGFNSDGQVGSNNTISYNYPVAVYASGVLSGKVVSEISAQGLSSCARTLDNLTYCWGWNMYGQLGNSSTTGRLVPVAVTAPNRLVELSQSVYQVYNSSTSASPGLALSSANWPATLPSPNAQFRIRLGLTNISSVDMRTQDVSARNDHGCAIGEDGLAYCWGANADGQLGNGTYSDSSSPVAVNTSGVLAGKTIVKIATNGGQSCAIASDAKAYCWGNNNHGQLGNNSTTKTNLPVAVYASGALSGKLIKDIVTAEHHTCALASDLKAYCWGNGGEGRLGRNSTTSSSVPVAVSMTGSLTNKTVSKIDASNRNHSCLISSDMEAYCWGYGAFGQLGTNSTANALVPTAVYTGGGFLYRKIRDISTSGFHSCALTDGNRIGCWGWNGEGQLGDGTTNGPSQPTMVSSSLLGYSVQSISTGYVHSCAITGSGQAFCWGGNGNGALGNRSYTGSTTPVAVYTGGALYNKKIKKINGGGIHSCALTDDGSTYCWGSGGNGRLGSGNSSTTNAAIAVVRGGMVSQTGSIPSLGLSLRLNVAPRLGSYSCSSVTSNWSQVGAASPINFGTSPPNNATSIYNSGFDPLAPTAGGYAYQRIVQSGMSFTNNLAIASNQTGLWDFVLSDQSFSSAERYCFKITATDPQLSVVNTSYIPEVITAVRSLDAGFVDNYGNTITNPIFDLSPAIVNSGCQAVGGTLGTYDKRIRVSSSLASGGWSLSLAATGGPGAYWQREGGGVGYDYNDSSGSPQGCNSGADGDGLAGRLSVDPTYAAVDPVGGCQSTGITRGSATGFSQGVVNQITLVNVASTYGEVCAWDILYVNLAQQIPARQPAGSYTINMTITAVSS